jgi:hypothetical protein
MADTHKEIDSAMARGGHGLAIAGSRQWKLVYRQSRVIEGERGVGRHGVDGWTQE